VGHEELGGGKSSDFRAAMNQIKAIVVRVCFPFLLVFIRFSLFFCCVPLCCFLLLLFWLFVLP
jgi:hypothetical protein